MINGKEKLTDATNSHLHEANGFKLERISYRIVGRVFFRQKKTFGWTKWRECWVELHKKKIMFYEWNRKRKQYNKVNFFFNDAKKPYILAGISYNNGMYTFTLTLRGRRIMMMKSPHKTAISLLYPEWHNRFI
jgi:hypothetical protein